MLEEEGGEENTLFLKIRIPFFSVFFYSSFSVSHTYKRICLKKIPLCHQNLPKMVSARAAGFIAVGSSLAALLTVFVYLPALLMRISEINEQVSTSTIIVIILFS